MGRSLACVLAALMLWGCGDDEPSPPMQRPRARMGSRGNFVGVFQPATATWTLRLQRPGWNEPESERTFVFGAPNDLPVVGDWDGDGQQTPGTFRDGLWTLSNSIEGEPLPGFVFGRRGHVPLVGDWDGDGVATVGLFYDGVFSLRNSNTPGMAETYIELGTSADIPIAGDWDGDGTDTVGIYSPSRGDFTLLDSNSTESGDSVVELGVKMATPVIGDWDDNRRDTVGVRLGADWTLLNDHRKWSQTNYGVNAELYGLGEIALSFGAADAIPVTGNWLPTASRGYGDAGELRELFPLAADYQWPTSFDTWADAGVNTMVRVRSKNDPLPADDEEIAAWTTKANGLGLKTIRQPREVEADDAGVLAWILYDEPDVQVQDPFAEIERAALRVQGTRPRLINFAGWSVLRQSELIQNVTSKFGPGDRPAGDFYTPYVALEDWASQDLYAISQMLTQQHLSLNDAMATLPLTFDKLRRWAPDKPQFAYIETSQHIDRSRPLSPAEFRAQVWLAIAGGVRGIFYFAANDCGLIVNGVRVPQCTEPDATQPEVRDELRKQNERITKLAHVLQGEVNPLSFSVSAPGPLDIAWRASEDGNYIIAVNGTTRSVARWIRIEGATASEVLDEEGRRIETEGGYTFRVTIPALDARVYRFR